MRNYEYRFEEVYTQGVFRQENFIEIIEEMADKGWRFVNWLPRRQNAEKIVTVVLVFEKVRNK